MKIHARLKNHSILLLLAAATALPSFAQDATPGQTR